MRKITCIYICIFQISSEYLILLVASVACRQNLDFSLMVLKKSKLFGSHNI
jgi:hypothetical protein